ncbi:hypothetical protein MNV49_007078 [Pseudohyphozyma bogoriensis]|nr:hypothetical protein MNV49_007078 [Pseudohyphozyma bogoriensis]
MVYELPPFTAINGNTHKRPPVPQNPPTLGDITNAALHCYQTLNDKRRGEGNGDDAGAAVVYQTSLANAHLAAAADTFGTLGGAFVVAEEEQPVWARGMEERTSAKINAVEAKIDAVEAKINTVEAKINTVEAKVTAVEGKIDGVETRLSNQMAQYWNESFASPTRAAKLLKFANEDNPTQAASQVTISSPTTCRRCVSKQTSRPCPASRLRNYGLDVDDLENGVAQLKQHVGMCY